MQVKRVIRLCSQCHPDRADSLAGSHDFGDRTDIRNAKGRTPAESDKCGFCHAMHDPTEGGLATGLQELALAGLNEADFRKNISDRLKQIKVVNQRIAPNVSISEAELREAYAKWAAEGLAGRVAEVQVCLLGWKSEEEKAETRTQAEEIARQARGGTDFDALMKKNCPNAAAGNSDRLQLPMDDLQPALREVIQGLNPGDVSDPVAAAGVWTVIKLEKMGAGTPASFEQQRENLASQIKQRKYDELYAAWVEDLRGKAKSRSCLRTVRVGLPTKTMGESVKPILMISQGDPRGIGPEIFLKAVSQPALSQQNQLVVVADESVMMRASCQL